MSFASRGHRQLAAPSEKLKIAEPLRPFIVSEHHPLCLGSAMPARRASVYPTHIYFIDEAVCSRAPVRDVPCAGRIRVRE